MGERSGNRPHSPGSGPSGRGPRGHGGGQYSGGRGGAARGGGGGGGYNRGGERGPDRGGSPGGRPGAAPLRVAPARQVAYRIVAHQIKRFPDLDLCGVDTSRLEPRDAALAHAIYDTVLRRWITLQYIVENYLENEWKMIDPRVRAALMCGAAQILLMDRLPSHAVVADSVEWVKAQAGPRAGGMVNAILRRIDELVWRNSTPGQEVEAITPEENPEEFAAAMKASFRRDATPPLPSDDHGHRERWTDRRDELPLPDGRSVALNAQALPKDPDERLSMATSHPLELIRAWNKSFDRREVRRLALHGLCLPATILNTAHATGPLPPSLVPHAAPGHHLWTGTHEELAELMRTRTDIWVQDPASSLAVQSVADLKPKIVFDMCAGLGTKTRQLAAAFPDATIYASDKDHGRFEKLKALFADHPRVKVLEWPREGASGFTLDFAGKVDLVLLDVPCSNTGVLARRIEARYRFNTKRTEELAAIQRQIIADAIPLLRRGAGAMAGGSVIVYSTCSLDPMENEEQAKWAARWHALEIARERRRMPEGGPGESDADGDPGARYSDGSYAVVLS
ncbi:MAG: hypothetical protein H6812_12550 [Phycisphaeraceae bacterium]|nr:hypothetical protein [Phycisphaerales bacterium]MCB9844068.1 hypothetical protein [Phycisphaeraceae bacterium]